MAQRRLEDDDPAGFRQDPSREWARHADRGGRIRVLVCDDHRLLTDTLTSVIASDDELDLVDPPVQSPEEALALCWKERPDVVLMDLEFRGAMGGIEATRRIKQLQPSTKVVVMTAHEEERLLVEAVEAGASGFLRKTEGVDELLDAVRAAAAGEVLIDQTALARLLPQVARERETRRETQLLFGQLTGREREILQLLAHGLSNDDVAHRLFISPQTVQTHVRNVLTKLGVHSKLEAVVFALKHGVVRL